MKQKLILLAVTALLFNACKKSSTPKTTNTSPTVLLSKVTNSLAGDPTEGKTLAQFTYNGRQLSKAVFYDYYITPPTTPDIETDLFNYDSQGHLTGSTITHSQPNDNDEVSSTVTYSSDNVGEIKFYKAGNTLDKDIKITYQSGKLTNWFDANEVSTTYTYNSDGNVTKDEEVEYQNGTPDGEVNTVNNNTFDTKSNLSGSLPFWIYFRSGREDQFLTYTPGKNNPITTDSFTYNYQYNTNGYPSAINWNDAYPQSYKYDYIQVN